MTKKKGRPRKAIKPPAKATPKSPTIAFASINDTQRTLVAQAQARLAKGKSIQNYMARALKDAWLTEMAVHIWPTKIAAAADCKISVSTFDSLAAQGCPGIEPHSPIPKAPVLAWLLANAHERGGDRGATTETAEAIETQIKQAKLAGMTGRLVAEAEDRANQAVIRIMTALRHHLQHTLAGALHDTVKKHPDRTDCENAIAQLLEAELRRFEPVRSAAAIAAPPTPAATQTTIAETMT